MVNLNRIALPAVSLLLAMPAGHLRAQQEPETGPDTAQEAEPLWDLALDVAATSASGNEELTVVASDAKVTRLVPDIVELVFTGRNRYGESRGQVVARSLRGSARFNFRPQGHWAPSLFVTGEQDTFKRLDLRLSAGGGALYTFVNEERMQYALAGSALYSYEDLLPPEGSTEETIQEHARWQFQFNGRQRLTEDLELTQTTQWEPVWDRASDYLLEAETGFRVRVTQNLALSISHVFQRDSTPPAEVKADDQVVKMGLNFTLGW